MVGPVHVLLLIDKLHRAGAQTNLVQVARGLDRSRFRPLVVCLSRGGELADELISTGIDVEVLGVDRVYGGRAMRALGRLSRTLLENDVKVLHTYLVSANLFGALACAVSGIGALVTTRRDLGFSRNWRLGVIEECFVNPRVDRVVTPAEAISIQARGERGLAPEKVVTIPNGVDTDFFRPVPGLGEQKRLELGIPPGALVVGVVANFLPVKGQADFLRAAARLGRDDVRSVLVGEGGERAALEALVGELGLRERVLFTGARSDRRELYSLFDVVVSPSHSEGMSNVLLEAMAMARPIVATSVGGSPELIQHGETGLLVPPRDPEALAVAMNRLLDGGAVAGGMAERARVVVAERFGLERMVERYMELYDDLLDRRSARPEG
jgi:glycosyltransferase involved in cell wall biosynthesis